MKLDEILKDDSKILVAGLGYRTGLMTANFLSRKGFSVHVCDMKDAAALKPVSEKLLPGIILHAGTQDASLLENGFDLIVLSPGVPAKIDLIRRASASGVPVIAEVELAYHFTKGSWIAITGTDGKSTTTAMTGHVLEKLGFRAAVGGNIGIPLISLAENSNENTVTVAELSSFQLETISELRPDISVIMNMGHDHLDRYDSMDDYFAAKMNITMNQNEDDVFLLNIDDEIILEGTRSVKASKLTFSLKNGMADIYTDGKSVYLNDGNGSVRLFDNSDMFIPGMHNIQNAMVCFLIAVSLYRKKNLKPDYQAIASHITSFRGLEHRMEKFAEFGGRTFINDSKATTVGAVDVAVRSLDRNSVFIVGGRGKGDDYSKLATIMKDRVRGVVLIGETQDEFEKIFSGFNCRKASGMENAVVLAYEMSSPGDTVILSPSCTSYDMYNNFEERGRSFKAAVDLLASGRI